MDIVGVKTSRLYGEARWDQVVKSRPEWDNGDLSPARLRGHSLIRPKKKQTQDLNSRFIIQED